MYEALIGKAPAYVCRIEEKGENDWITTIQNAFITV